MRTSESERLFSTLKRIKTLLSSTMSEDGLNDLAMIAMEKKMCQNKDINTKVIDWIIFLNKGKKDGISNKQCVRFHLLIFCKC